MTGYIGSRAKKRRRNFLLLIFFLLVLGLIIIIIPNINFYETNPTPEDTLLPKSDEEISSLSTKVEDLNLTIFQKDQKIKFRDGQINNLKKEISSLKINYENIQADFITLQDEYNKFVESNSNKTNLQAHNKQINDLTDKIKTLNKLNEKNQIMISEFEKKLSNLQNENKNNTSNAKKISSDKEALKKEYKIVVSKNMKLSNLVKNLESIIISLESEIKGLESELKNLRDKISHH